MGEEETCWTAIKLQTVTSTNVEENGKLEKSITDSKEQKGFQTARKKALAAAFAEQVIENVLLTD